jgi:hypothetical protein
MGDALTIKGPVGVPKVALSFSCPRISQLICPIIIAILAEILQRPIALLASCARGISRTMNFTTRIDFRRFSLRSAIYCPIFCLFTFRVAEAFWKDAIFDVLDLLKFDPFKDKIE